MRTAPGLALAIVLAFAEGSTAGPPEHSGRQHQLRVSIPRIDAEVTIDGILDETAWREAARLNDFSQYFPADGQPANDGTEILVWYGPTAIYFGIRAQAAPDSVRATLADRDRIDSDDHVQIFLSTFNDRRQALMFAVNPFGVQADGVLVEGTRTQSGGFGGLQTGRETTDLSPDFVFQSKGRVTTEGYDVELRIPFKSLRFPTSARQDWGVHVVRKVQSSGHEDSWVPAERAGTSFLAQAGTLEGLTDLKRGVVLDLNPVVTAKANGAPAERGWEYRAGSPEFGGNVRWGLTPNLTVNGTLNPDFSQVEADAGQLQFDPRQAVFFPEKRPFFLDGIEQFATPNQLIYTRRIVAPLAAAKLTGKVGTTTLAFLSAVDDRAASATLAHHPVVNLARVQRDLGGQSRIAAVYTDRIDGSDDNRVAASDARIAFGGLYALQLQGAVSRTHRQGATATAPLWDAVFTRNGRRFGLRYQLRGIHHDFTAGSGFIPRGGVAYAAANHRLTLFGRKDALVESWSGDVLLDGIWVYQDFVDGRGAQDRRLHVNNNVVLRGGWRAGGSVLLESFGFDGRLYTSYALERAGPDGVEILPFTGTPRLPNLDFVTTLATPRFKKFSGNVFVLWGRDENFFEWASANILFTNLSADWRPTDQVRVNAGYQLQHYRRRTDGSVVGERRIPRVRFEYQLTRSIFVRWIGEYDANRQDDLRDDSRTGLPIVIRDPSTGAFRRALGFERNLFRSDWLFSYLPTPGTVVFAGYGSLMTEPQSLSFRSLRRTSDGFFLKISYLFRV